MTKACTACHTTQPVENFWRHSQRPDGRHGQCQTCMRKRDRSRDRNTPEQNRARQLKSRYGLTPTAWEAMAAGQGYRCALCRRQTKLVVDHDHETGKVRGLLCRACNTALGALGDSLPGLARALSYVNDGSVYDD